MEQFIRFWKSSIEWRLLPAPNHTDGIFKEILPVIDLWTRESLFNFGSHPENTDLCQVSIMAYLPT